MISPARHSDGDARRLIATAIDDTLIVEAAAGTGKTTELVDRIVGVLAAGRADVREIVAVTFTEKAAGELKLRLRERLEFHRRNATDPDVLSRLHQAVQNLEEAHVSTIHGFCADLLRERPVEAGVDPMFRVLTETQSRRLFEQAFDAWFQARLERPSEGVRRSLRRTSRGFRAGDVDEDGPVERLRRAGFGLAEWRDFRAPWTRPPFARAPEIARLIDLVHALADATVRPSYAGDNLHVDTAPVRRLSQELRNTGGDNDLDGLEARFVELRRNRDFRRARKGTGPTYAKGKTRAEVLAARDALVLALDDFQVRADADLAGLLHTELLEAIDEYEAFKRREGALDFLDLLLRARNLVRDDGPVRRHFQERFKRIFVDEFQDTDPLQAELLLLLSANDPNEARWERVTPLPGKLFLVGDPKQSIYRFRRADVDVYRRVCQQLERAGGRRVELRKSFRGVPALQRFVNAAFAAVMDGDPDTLQARYVPLEPARAEWPAQPAVVALPVPNPYGHRFVSAREIEQSLPDAIGAYVDWLVKCSGWTVTERRRPTVRVPLEPRHVCLLFRRFVSYGEDVTRKYVEALEARGIHHLLVGGRAFHDREEIETLRAALMAIEWPDDRLSIFATLRGALFAIGDEDLLEYHRMGGRFHPFGVPSSLPARLSPIGEALDLIGTLHRHRNRRPVADTISTLLSRTRAHVGFVLRPAGEQALANVLHVAELARQYEVDGGMSFRGFVETFDEEAAGAAAEAPILEEGSDGVRLMTVHKAKGLEFPVVILADITARLTPFEAGRFIDSGRGLCALRIGGWSPSDLNEHRDLELRREQREGERVAYVAATRARDLLVVPAVGDGPYGEGWISPMNAALYPPEDRRREQAAGPGCPTFRSRDTVLNRPDGDPARTCTVSPGAHRFDNPEGEYSVVWWSPEPEALTLGAQPLLGLRRDDLIVKDVAPTVLRSYLDAYTTWRLSRQAAIQEASAASISVATATQVAALGAAPEDSSDFSVTVEEVGAVGDRPHGLRFGLLVHGVLADVPLAELPEARRQAVSRLAASHGRILGADEVEIAASQDLVLQVLAHPLLQAAAASAERGHCHRETPISCVREDGTLVEGTVDLAFQDSEGFVVIDFKTDRPASDQRRRYERQVAWYAASLARASGRKTKGVLLIV